MMESAQSGATRTAETLGNAFVRGLAILLPLVATVVTLAVFGALVVGVGWDDFDSESRVGDDRGKR